MSKQRKRPAADEPCLRYLLTLHEVCVFQTIEGQKYGPASKSELRRWLQNSAVWLNGKPVKPEDPKPWPIYEVILFPKNPKKRCTLLSEPPEEPYEPHVIEAVL